jgi:hypothetical protein
MKPSTAMVLIFIALLGACDKDSKDKDYPKPDTSSAASDAVSPATELAENTETIETTALSSAKPPLMIGVECKAPVNNVQSCVSGNYQIELIQNCESGAFYAGVAQEGGVILKDRIVGDDPKDVAKLSDKQFVCVQGIAKTAQESEWFYVVAVPVSEVTDCKDNSICQDYGDKPVDWLLNKPTGECHLVGTNGFTGSCAAGWIKPDALDQFSNGL